jgi:myosin-7
MNPYKTMPIYGADMIQRYRGKQLGEMPPHIFATANHTYSSMMKTGINQVVVISGESGAGKTETTKLMIHYLASVSPKKSIVQQQIVDASPILEAFGNAKTVRNDNSSRFGKFLEIQFDRDGSIIGSMTRQYLLEKVYINRISFLELWKMASVTQCAF